MRRVQKFTKVIAGRVSDILHKVDEQDGSLFAKRSDYLELDDAPSAEVSTPKHTNTQHQPDRP
jgi:hypothetical protein